MNKIIRKIPIRARAALLLVAIVSLGFLPLLDALVCALWSRGMRSLGDELSACYSPWWGAVKNIFRALVSGEEQ